MFGLDIVEKTSELLVKQASHLILLFTPPFDQSLKDPGYIKGYVAGVRENGGQYTHAAIWVLMAYAKLGNGNTSYDLFQSLNPIQHSATPAKAENYRLEPYVMPGDIYSGGGHEGRGGWSWYTGSSAWYYRACLESILGFQLEGNRLVLNPCVPSQWKSYEIKYRHKNTLYLVQVLNPDSNSGGRIDYQLDGKTAPNPFVELTDDGKDHKIVATIRGL